MHVRTATIDDVLDVRRILDAAMLEPGDVEARIAEGNVLVAGDRRGGSTDDETAIGDGGGDEDDERILGAVVLEPRERGSHVSAIGVRRRQRGRGIGRLLMERALEREAQLTAHFDDGVRPFYERLGFSIEPIDDRRHRGVKQRDGGA
ncbi:GNAT family N-acetyltransferase [Halosolutus gelatinilyticus]|uniref:GNAT family N-acetyltransferase n=1 Tax=Halosolutus gelatinilyticus TaxID=2931975 RepID=UPI001FF67022|nr:GNAT family N-acetyltransferase [Halosolutus gelatinilyticus]